MPRDPFSFVASRAGRLKHEWTTGQGRGLLGHLLTSALVVTVLAGALVAASVLALGGTPAVRAQESTATPVAEGPDQPRTGTPTQPLPPTETPRATRTPGGFPTSGFPFPASPTATSVAKPTETPAEEGLEREERPIVVISGYEVDPQRPAPDQTFHLKLTVANEGEHDAENIQISLGGDSFIPASGGDLFINQLQDGDDTTAEADLSVATGVEPGTHPLSLSLRWDDSYGGSYTDQQSISIEVGGPGTRRPLLVVASSKVPGRVAPGVPFTMVLDLLNSGGSEARNVVVVPTGGPLALQGAGGSPPATIGPGGRQTLTLRVQAGQVAEPGAVSQMLELRYDDPNGERYTDQVTVGLAVTDDAAYGPLPMVAAYAVEPGELHPGQVFELVLQITNVGVADALRTRLAIGGGTSGAAGSGAAAVASSAGAFAPVATSNVRFLDRLKVDEMREVRQKMVVDGNAKPGNYTLSMGFVYFDADGKAQESSEVVSLLVTRPVVLQINAIGLVESTFVGDIIPLNLEILNAGLATVNGINVDVKVGGLLAVLEGVPHFVGSLDAGSPDTLEVQLEAKKAGSAEATVVVDYLDDQSRPQRAEKTFTFKVEEAPEPSAEASRPEPVEGNWFVRLVKGFLGLGASPGFAVPAPSMDEGGDAEPDSGSGPPGGGGVIVRPVSPRR